MEKSEETLVAKLKSELEFLDRGGYARSPAHWRVPLIFEDSPICVNYQHHGTPAPCSECVLMQLVPPEFRDSKVPCRHIPFSANGASLANLYHHLELPDLESIYRKWLIDTIAEIEVRQQLAQKLADRKRPVLRGDNVAMELLHALHPKCANPSCPVTFHWLAGGRFFRFEEGRPVQCITPISLANPPGHHFLKHFWLCEDCAAVFTLQYGEEKGVVVELLPNELPAAVPAV